MHIFANHKRGRALANLSDTIPFPSINADAVRQLLERCPAHAQTPLVRNCQTLKVTDALIAYCRNAKISRLGFLSPYRADVSETLRHRLPEAMIQTPSFGYFGEQREAAVVRISQSSIKKAVGEIEAIQDLKALFLSCTNLHTNAHSARSRLS